MAVQRRHSTGRDGITGRRLKPWVSRADRTPCCGSMHAGYQVPYIYLSRALPDRALGGLGPALRATGLSCGCAQAGAQPAAGMGAFWRQPAAYATAETDRKVDVGI